MTHILQPLDLTINGFAKKFCKKKFNHWYMEQIMKQLGNGKSIQDIDVKILLTTLKPLTADWLAELYSEINDRI